VRPRGSIFPFYTANYRPLKSFSGWLSRHRKSSSALYASTVHVADLPYFPSAIATKYTQGCGGVGDHGSEGTLSPRCCCRVSFQTRAHKHSHPYKQKYFLCETQFLNPRVMEQTVKRGYYLCRSIWRARCSSWSLVAGTDKVHTNENN